MPLPLSCSVMPSSTPGGISTCIFFLAVTLPDALQFLHGFSIISPIPLHVLQVSTVTKVENLFSVTILFVCPSPLHPIHFLRFVPGEQPVPLHSEHFSNDGTSIVSFLPVTISSSVRDKSITVSSPLLLLPKLKPNPNGSPLFLAENPPPNSCSKISLIPPNPISLNISSKLDSDPLKTSSDPT